MVNAYDAVAYPGSIYPRSHPHRIAAIGLLSGMEPASTERCRVLELGCGDATNLLSLAYAMPESQFVGIDLAAEPVARGAALAGKLGLSNITLIANDVAAVDPRELGPFDYIIAYGLYSWVPAPVREAIMALCGQLLNPQGIAYLSYNAFPGHHIRQMSRHMMRYHQAHFTDSAQQIAQARGVLKMAAGADAPTDLYRQILVAEDERVSEIANGSFFHDDLGADNQPFYFHEFMDHAARHGLQFLGEADVADYREVGYSPEARAALAQIDPDDIVAREQYRDFLRGRAFRRTLLCRQGITLDRTLNPAAMNRMYFASELQPTSGTPENGSDRSAATEIFQGSGKLRLETNRPEMKAALRRIGEAWPGFLSFPELWARVEQDLKPQGLTETAVAAAMLEAAMAGVLDVRTRPAQCARTPGARPVASALARLQAATGPCMTTLLHQVVALDDAFSRRFVGLLDGTRDRAQLLAELAATAVADGRSVTGEHMENVLQRLARLGLLLRTFCAFCAFSWPYDIAV